MSPRTLSASTLVFSPLKAAGFLFGGIALAIVITGCSPAEPKKSETEKQASSFSSSVASSAVQKNAVSSTAPTLTPRETVPAPKSAMSPKETYINMMTEYSNVKTVADIEAVFLKYGSKKLIAGLEAGVPEMNAASASERNEVVAEVKSNAVLAGEIITIQESINGSTATVSGSTKSRQKFIVILVLENNRWKVDGGDI